MTRSPKSIAIAAVLAVGTLSSACSTNRYGESHLNNTGKGALIGGAGGAGIAAVTGGDVVGGAALGAAAGAITGIVTTDHHRYEDRGGRRYYYDDRNRRYYYDDRRHRHWDNGGY